MRRSRLRLIVVTSAAVGALGLLLVLFRAPLLRASVAAVLDVATGFRFSFGSLELQADHVVARHVEVTRADEPVLALGRLDARFNLRDLLPGGARRYGLVRVDLIDPTLVLIRHADGSFNVSSHSRSTAPGAPARGDTGAPPWNARVTVANGRIDLIDDYRVLPNARRLSLDGLSATLALSDARRVRYLGTGEVAGDRAQRFTFAGRIDDGGYALHRLRARTIAIAPLLDYLINSETARVDRGYLRALDVRAYSFAAGTSAPYHLDGSGTLDDGAMRVPGLRPLATGIGGRLDLFDTGIAAPHLAARLGRIRVALAGGLFGWQTPAFRLGLATRSSPLVDVRALFTFARRLPLAGTASLASLLEGPAATPLVATVVTSDALAYGPFPVENVRGRAIYYDGSVNVAGLRGRYGGLAVRADGAIDLGPRTQSRLVVDVGGPAAGIPYLAQLAPAADVDAVTLLSGRDLRLDARGALVGSGVGGARAGLFHIDPLGYGTFGPFTVRRDDGTSIAGAFLLDRSRSASGFWLQANDFGVARLARPPRLPGLALAAPELSGRLTGSVAGVGPPSAFRLAGHAHARDLRIDTVRIDDVSGDLAGAPANLRLGRVVARGSWGTFGGRGAFVRGRLALEGAYRGDFSQLATLTGDLGARGRVVGPVALLIGPAGSIVQARGDVTPGASVRGVPLAGFDGTLEAAGSRLRVYAATAEVAGGTLAAAGTLDHGGAVGVSLSGARADRIAGLPPLGAAGRIAAIGMLSTPDHAARFDGGLTIDGGALDSFALAANGDVALAASRLNLQRVDAVLGAALGSLAGSVSGLGTKRPRYDLGLHLAVARVAPFARVLAPKRHDIVGTATGDVRVTGSVTRPALAGTVAVPEGSVNGLAFRAAEADVDVADTGVTARRGTVTVGSTRVGFGALLNADDTALRLDAPRVDLADFNDYFDAGDTLGGRGRIDGGFSKHGRT
ncbi:MAG: hypothetical protein IAI50_00945, partial [Candidatus Eremiobacteraeota bacterium]|nr:hypothetical protein [Candidatus Eremiobacteraeota bacterium]